MNCMMDKPKVSLNSVTLSTRFPCRGNVFVSQARLLPCPLIHYYSDQIFEAVASNESKEQPYKLAKTGFKVLPLLLLLVKALDTMDTDVR